MSSFNRAKAQDRVVAVVVVRAVECAMTTTKLVADEDDMTRKIYCEKINGEEICSAMRRRRGWRGRRQMGEIEKSTKPLSVN